MAIGNKTRSKARVSQTVSKESVSEAIRAMIRASQLAPGQRLIEAELCELLGASRGAVRASLMDLTAEGVVERIENRGARVRVVGLQEALDIAEVRLSVESVCVTRAAEKITDAEIAELRKLGEDLKTFSERNDVHAFVDTSRKIRQLYVRVANQPVAEEMLQKLRDRMTGHQFRLTYQPGRAQATLPFWLELIDALARRDPDWALNSVRRHVEDVQQAMIALSQQHAAAGSRPIRPNTVVAPLQRPRQTSTN